MAGLDNSDLAPPPAEDELRDAFSCMAAGVAIVTARNKQGEPRAMTVSSLISVSLDPPLILFCLAKSAYHFDVFIEAKAFAVNCLSRTQTALSNRFAEECDDDLRDLTLHKLKTGSPMIMGSLAALDCLTENHHQAGDHIIVVGRITALNLGAADDPLLYYQRAYRDLRPSDDG